MKFRGQFDYDVEAASDEATLEGNGIETGESLTVQSQTEDTDINVLMKRFGVTGKLPDNPRVPMFGDFTGINDFHSAMRAIVEAEDAFMEFPADVRAKFDNDPQKVMEFISNDANYAEAIKLGLMKEGAKAPTPASGAPPAQPAAPAVGAPPGAPVAPVVP